MSTVPYLQPDEREAFLVDHGMIEEGPCNDSQRDWLESVNFHFLMGYARHYRNLINESHWEGPKNLTEIQSLVNSEDELAAFLAPWIRRAETHLRALTVKYYCEQQLHGEGYLDMESWAQPKKHLQLTMLKDIQRHGEPYVQDHIDERARQAGFEVPEWCISENRGTWLSLVQELPLWSVIDSFSIGTLGKFLLSCGCQPCGEKPVGDLVAAELDIGKNSFNKSVQCFGITRNLIFHHQRIWMRPIPMNPGFAKDLDRRYKHFELRTTYKQAHFVALASLSKLLPTDCREKYLEQLDLFLELRPLLALGIIQPPFLKFTPLS
ncbi:Abi family protein [Corynebacterium glutamicum]|uniref:Abi family protein n=1 Tax=Corynebacterium glutamicum TaxID=1718 RepID=UPI00058A3ED9|nr:Abi family protein [Corynebacterium glutamicum]KIH74479.1 hypothetical protein SD36_02610 [Corynebacterium glutamicum]